MYRFATVGKDFDECLDKASKAARAFWGDWSYRIRLDTVENYGAFHYRCEWIAVPVIDSSQETGWYV